jgi:glutamate racemase
MDDRPIGIFDSGVGGLSVLAQIHRLIPNEVLIFFADQAHVPYGSRSLTEVRAFSQGITEFLIRLRAKIIVVACNTASAASLHNLRAHFPETPFVGMEPAVKPAALATQSRVVGVLATPATFQGALYASVVERFANDVTVITETIPGLVEQIESGDLDGQRTKDILKRAVRPMLKEGVDTLVLACTHYPFIIPTLSELVGPSVQVIDPSPAIARQTKRILQQHSLTTPSKDRGELTFISSSDASEFKKMTRKLIDESGEFASALWEGTRLMGFLDNK